MEWGLVGNRWAIELLRRQLERSAVHHAYLFAGPEGIGRREMALAFARVLLCQEPPAAGRACGACQACRQVPAGTYPDLHWIEREEGRQGIAIDQVRELQRRLSLTSLAGRGRVAVLVDFEKASEGAANALLKTLEEPPAHVRLLITASDPEAVPATITSRCEVLMLRPVAREVLVPWLEAQGGSAEKAGLAAEASDGRPALARRALEDGELLERHDGHTRSLEEVLGLDLPGRLAVAEGWKEAPLVEERLRVWARVLREDVRRAAGAAGAAGPGPPRLGRLGFGASQHALRLVVRTLEALERNANTRLALEALLLDLPEA